MPRRTLTKDKPIKEKFFEEFARTVASQDDTTYDAKVWKAKPVDINEFCENYLDEPLFPVQSGMGEAMCGETGTDFEVYYTKGIAYWGKGCFVGDTKVNLTCGKHLSFEKWYNKYRNKKFWVYSQDKNLKIIPGLAHSPRITKYVNRIIEIKLDDGEKIICTPEHLFRLKSGKWIQALYLKNNVALMGMYRHVKVVSKKVIQLEKKIPVFDITVNKYHNFLLSAGIFVHNSGKDRTISKIQTYMAYKLMNLYDPQKFLRDKYSAALGHDSPIDMGNVSITAQLASDVYFKNFKGIVRMTKNPDTGKNWFEERGVDLREGYDIHKNEIVFPHNITCHSLNSETYTGEGLNLFFVAFDEFSAFKTDKAFTLLYALEDTVTSRFPDVGKVCVFSYKYYENDPTQVLYKRESNNPRTFRSKAKTWQVNLFRKKRDFAIQYTRNPEKAKMTYECEGGEMTGGYVTKKYMLSNMFDRNRENPVVGDLISVKGNGLLTLKFKDWFKPVDGIIYGFHGDLAKGKIEEGGDAAGLALVHLEKMKPKIDSKLIADLTKEGILIDAGAMQEHMRKGVVADLALQVVAERAGEIDISIVRKFILMLRDMGFNIQFATFDGWQSLESIQLLLNEGINAFELSVDRKNDAYDTWKELMYQQLTKCYPHKIAEREAKELILNDKGKVDHPEKSWQRELDEGVEKGSKDVMDSIVGAGKNIWENVSLEPDIYFF